MNTLTQTAGSRGLLQGSAQQVSPHPTPAHGGTCALSRQQLHERLRSAKYRMDRAQSDLAYWDAKESFDDCARQLADLPLEGV